MLHRHVLFLAVVILPVGALAADIPSSHVRANLSIPNVDADYWKGVPSVDVSLMAQPMAIPRPSATTTATVAVQSLHDGHWISFRLRWKDSGKDAAGHLGEYSDGVAIQFPIKAGPPPPVFMGAKDNPVHIYHWRAQYQEDRLRGKPTMKELYPNMSVDMYPMEYADPGQVQNLTTEERERFSPGRASGNPQAFSKTGVDEIYAEGFSTSSVQEGSQSQSDARWDKGEWTVVITRRMSTEGGSNLVAGGSGWMGFAVWQGDKGEVGSRKCVTMMWTPLVIGGAKS